MSILQNLWKDLRYISNVGPTLLSRWRRLEIRKSACPAVDSVAEFEGGCSDNASRQKHLRSNGINQRKNSKDLPALWHAESHKQTQLITGWSTDRSCRLVSGSNEGAEGLLGGGGGGNQSLNDL